MTDNQHLSDIEIEMALDDQLPPLRQAHLAGCDRCKAQVDSAAQAVRSLKTRLYRRTCPSSQRLAQFEFRELHGAAYSTIEDHVALCPRCQEELAVLRAYMGDGNQTSQPKAAQRARPPLTQPLRAHLAPHEMLRGAQKTPRLSFDVAGVHVFLEVANQGQEMVVSGQIVAEIQSNWEDALVQVSHNNTLMGIATANEIGEFRLVVERTAAITLRITNNDGDSIFVEDIHSGFD